MKPRNPRRERKFWVIDLLTYRRVEKIAKYCTTHNLSYSFDKGYIIIKPNSDIIVEEEILNCIK